MRFSESAAYILGFILLSSAASTHAQETSKAIPSANPIRVSVDRVAVGVTVVGTHRNFVQGLRREDFRLYDDDVAQEITGFFPIQEPAQVVLMMENGPAALFIKPSAMRAAEGFLGSIAPTDKVAIVSYSRVPTLELDFTADKSKAEEELKGLSFMDGYAQLNLMSSVITTLDWLSSVPGKKTIVLLSTGLNDSSPADWQVIQRKLESSDVQILAVSIADALRTPLKEKKLSLDERDERKYVQAGFAEGDRILRLLTSATGGHVYFPMNAKEFTEAYGEIAQFVRNEYRLEFVPPSEDGKLHALKVKVRPAWYHVNYRQAYFAPEPPSEEPPR
ncbi:MAG: VWA domain-containing protein [Candidatus Acidiferrales bacterium]